MRRASGWHSPRCTTSCGRYSAGIKSATPSGARVVGVGHYDPYLGDYFRGPGGRTFAIASLNVMERLDATLRSDYAAARVPIADVASAFDLSDRRARAVVRAAHGAHGRGAYLRSDVDV